MMPFKENATIAYNISLVLNKAFSTVLTNIFVIWWTSIYRKTFHLILQSNMDTISFLLFLGHNTWLKRTYQFGKTFLRILHHTRKQSLLPHWLNNFLHFYKCLLRRVSTYLIWIYIFSYFISIQTLFRLTFLIKCNIFYQFHNVFHYGTEDMNSLQHRLHL